MARYIALVLALVLQVLGHTIITYPGYRGNNLFTNGTVEESNGLGVAYKDGSYMFPYGMEWIYPCGGMPTSSNRTKWPVGGGAVAFQPAWFPGHDTAFIYMNMGLGSIPPNMSNPMIKTFQISGPTNMPYPGTVCLPQVPLPADWTVKAGDHATIQLVLAAKHGAALYNVCLPLPSFPFPSPVASFPGKLWQTLVNWYVDEANGQCVDIEFADPKDVAEVTRENCFNSSDISFDQIFAASSLKSSDARVVSIHWMAVVMPVVTMLLVFRM